MNGGFRRDTYTVNVFDCAGEYKRVECDSFGDVLTVVALMRAMYRGKIVAVFNRDRCDYDTNGLTEDERDAIGEAR